MPPFVHSADVGSLRSRIVKAAAIVTCDTGWSSVTMSLLAEMVGVSRQTVYNEIGSKRQLAEEVVFTELQEFLALVDGAFEAHPHDMTAAVRAAVHDVLVLAAESPLIHAIVSTSHGAQHDLLPLLTTRSETLIETAKNVIHNHLVAFAPPLSGRELSAAADVVVRAVLSHVMQPSATPDETADDIAGIAARILA